MKSPTTAPAGWQSRSRRTPRRGMAALTTVMILFFVMALVAAYTNRNLIFEQRISANSYRANRALAATDAGVEWTIAMLNGGRIDGNCQPSTDSGNDDFRRRYLRDSTDPTLLEGGYELAWGTNSANAVFPACIVVSDGSSSCICPRVGGTVPAINSPTDGIGSSFRIGLLLPGSAVRPGAVQFTSRGCANPGSGDSACYAQTANENLSVDGVAGALATVGLVRALPVPPIAALTAGTTITATGGGELWLANGDPERGLTAYAGGAITPGTGGTDRYIGPAGSGSDGRVDNDPVLAALAATVGEADDVWFRSMFGMDMAMFQRSPATRWINCTAGCTMTNLTNIVAGYPRNPIFLTGDNLTPGNLNLDTAGTLGSDADPVMLVVNGTLTVSADVRIIGFVHANNIVWSAGGASVKGAMVSTTGFTTTARATLAYDRSVLDLISLRYGSFVLAPGGWNLTIF